MKIELHTVDPPKFEFTQEIPQIPASEYKQRIKLLYTSAESDWVIIYGDREHSANLTYLTNFDPRFEEAGHPLSENSTGTRHDLSLPCGIPGTLGGHRAHPRRAAQHPIIFRRSDRRG